MTKTKTKPKPSKARKAKATKKKGKPPLPHDPLTLGQLATCIRITRKNIATLEQQLADDHKMLTSLELEQAKLRAKHGRGPKASGGGGPVNKAPVAKPTAPVAQPADSILRNTSPEPDVVAPTPPPAEAPPAPTWQSDIMDPPIAGQ